MERVLFINTVIAARIAAVSIGYVLHGSRVADSEVYPLMQRGEVKGWYVLLKHRSGKSIVMTESVYEQLIRLTQNDYKLAC